MHGTCVPLWFAYALVRNDVGLRSQAQGFLPNYIDALSLQQRKRIQWMTLIFVSGTLPLFAVSIALGSIETGSPTHRSDCIKQQVTFV